MTLALFLLAVGSVASPELVFRFIGNNGFEISDGATTILVDFPYRSGAFGYMAFDTGELQPRDHALCLFTHRHDDHFDPARIDSVGCLVAGPPEVQSRTDPTSRLGEGPVWTFGRAEIVCLETAHGDVDHCSYVIRWHDQSIFVSGDVEELSGLFALDEPLDVIIIAAWLAPEVARIRARFPTARIILSHHIEGEDRARTCNCVVPAQGRSYRW